MHGEGRRAAARKRRSLDTGRHAVYELAPELLLVFKPRGHREEAHRHSHRQRLRVLRGRLQVRAGREVITLGPASGPLRLRAGRMHETLALDDVWLVVET